MNSRSRTPEPFLLLIPSAGPPRRRSRARRRLLSPPAYPPRGSFSLSSAETRPGVDRSRGEEYLPYPARMIGFICFFFFFSFLRGIVCFPRALVERVSLFLLWAPRSVLSAAADLCLLGVRGRCAWKKVTQLNSPLHLKQIRGCSIESSRSALGPI